MADPTNEDIESPLSSFAEKLSKQTTDSQRVLDEHRARLMNLMSSRKQLPFDPKLMALGAGFLAPTKTGSFGESLGYGMKGYAQEAEQEMARQQAEAKMMYELETQAQGQKRDLLGQQLMAELFTKEQGAPAGAPAPAAAPAAPTPVPAAATAPGAAPEAPAKPTAQVVANAIPELALPEIPRSRIARMSDEQIAMLKAFNPTMGGILEGYRKAFREGRELQIKEVNLQRELRELATKESSVERTLPGVGNAKLPMNFWNALDKAETFDDVQSLYKKYRLPMNITVAEDGNPRFMTAEEITTKQKKEEARFNAPIDNIPVPELGGGTFPMDRVMRSEYIDAKRRGPNALQLFFNQSFPEAKVKIPGARIGALGTPAGAPAEPAAPESVEERGIRTKRGETLATKEAESTIKLDDTIRNAGKQADSIIQNSDTLLDLMKKPEYSGAWGMFAGKGIANAAVNFINEGIQVGNFNVGLPALKNSLKQANMTDEQIEASARAMQIYGEQKLQIARRELAGEGSVSDGERRLVGDVSASVDTPIKSAMATAELFKYRAEFDKKNASMYNAWRDKNPNMPGNRYYDAKEYKGLVKEYDGVMNALRQKYFPTRQRPAAQRPAASSAPAASGNANPFLQ